VHNPLLYIATRTPSAQHVASQVLVIRVFEDSEGFVVVGDADEVSYEIYFGLRWRLVGEGKLGSGAEGAVGGTDGGSSGKGWMVCDLC
jgi:hypothetical protein